MPLKRPWLVQRCESGEMELTYDYMGSTEFECGGQPKSLKRIFAAGMAEEVVNITIRGKEIPVYLVAIAGFPFAEYQPHLQRLAEGKLRLQEWTDFSEAVKTQAGLEADRATPRTNVWFDFENDALWTLTEAERTTLVATLEVIRQKWGEGK